MTLHTHSSPQPPTRRPGGRALDPPVDNSFERHALIPGMRSRRDFDAILAALNQLTTVEHVEGDPVERTITIHFRSSGNWRTAERALSELGYPPTLT